MMKGEKQITGVIVLEELQMLQLELEYNSSMRKRVEILTRLVVQELTLEALTMEKLTWMVRPLLEGRNDSEERVIRTRMKPTIEDFEEATLIMAKSKYDRIPMGLVGSAKQIMATSKNFERIYSQVQKADVGTQTEGDGFDSEDDESLFQSAEGDSLEQYFKEDHHTDKENF